MTMLRRINCAEATDRAPFYVLGALDPREAAEVREHLESCSRPHEEFAQLGAVVPYLAEAVPEATPSPALRDRILAAVAADVRAGRRDDHAAERLVASIGTPARQAAPEAGAPEAEGTPATSAGPSPAGDLAPAGVTAGGETAAAAPDVARRPEPIPIAAVRERRARRPWARWLLQAAAVLVIAVLAGWNLLLQRDVLDARREAEAARRDASAIQRQTAEARQRAELVRDALAAREAPGAKVADLEFGPAASGPAAESGASGFVVLLPARDGYFVVYGLPPAPSGKTYQVWYVTGGIEGRARSAGLVQVAPEGVAVLGGLRPGGTVDTVAVSIEEERGAAQPTNQLMHGHFGSSAALPGDQG